MNITRRQFMQYCTASAAALGLSQLDLLKIEKALASTACGANTHGAPRLIWFQGQSCGGCTLSILNRMRANVTTANPTPLDGASGLVQDVVDLLVGDGVRYVSGTTTPTVVMSGRMTLFHGALSLVAISPSIIRPRSWPLPVTRSPII
jgi:hypothetical protein